MTPATSHLTVALFGQPRVSFDGTAVRLQKSRTTLPLLAYLLLHRNKPVAREFLAFTLWPDVDDETALGYLRRYLYVLQKSLPEAPDDTPWIISDAETLRWNEGAPVDFDVAEFERLSENPATLASAIDRYGGELLENLYDDWVFSQRERLRNLYLSDLSDLIAGARRRRESQAAADYARRLLAVDPWREDVVRQLIGARYEIGDGAGALHEFDAFARRLRDEMGIDPMPETVSLRDAIARNASLSADEPRTADAVRQASTPEDLLPFVGRDADLDQLLASWSRAARGKGSLVFVGGEAGIGKTRLAHELMLQAEREGARILVGATTYPEHAPYQPLADALRSVLPIVATSNLDPVWLAVIAGILPELRTRKPDLPDAPPLEPSREQLRLCEALALCLAALSQPRPVLLLLEDVHWAGETTISAIRYLTRRIAAVPVLIAVTYREEEAARSHPLRTLRREMQEERLASHISLRRLTRQAVRTIVAAVPELHADELDAADALFEQSEGNPLFLVEAIRDARLGDRTAVSDGSASGTVPAGIRAMVASRLGHVSQASRAVAEVAAVFGHGFNVEVVRDVGGWSEGEVLDALDELIERHIVREAGGRGRFDYSFTHHLIQSSIYDAMDAAAKTQRHRRIGRVLEQVQGEWLDDLRIDIALHYDRGGAPELAAPRYLAAARRAFGMYANDEARAAVVRGLELADDDALRSRFMMLREEVHGRLGDRAAQRADLDEMDALAERMRDEALAFEAAIRRIAVHHANGERTLEERHIADLKTRVGADGDPHRRALVLKAEAAHRYLTSRFDEAQQSAHEALALYRQCADADGEGACLCLLAEIAATVGDFVQCDVWLAHANASANAGANRALVAKATMAAGLSAVLRQDFALCERLDREALELFRAIGDREGEATVLGRLGVPLGRALRTDEARRHYDEAARMFDAIGKRQGVAAMLTNRGIMELWLGRMDEAQQLWRAALGDFEFLRDRRGQVICMLNLSLYELLRGNARVAKDLAAGALEEARALADQALESIALGNLGSAERDLGELAPAIAHMQAALQIREGIERPADLVDDLADLAIAFLQAGDRSAASRVEERIRTSIAQGGSGTNRPWNLHWVSALVDRANGRAADADASLRRAHALLLERAARIDIDADRERFLEAPFNLPLRAAAEEQRWPLYAEAVFA